jgi:hypothetical protein
MIMQGAPASRTVPHVAAQPLSQTGGGASIYMSLEFRRDTAFLMPDLITSINCRSS